MESRKREKIGRLEEKREGVATFARNLSRQEISKIIRNRVKYQRLNLTKAHQKKEFEERINIKISMQKTVEQQNRKDEETKEKRKKEKRRTK